MVKNRARKTAATERRATTGENHRQAVDAVRRTPHATVQGLTRLVTPGERAPRDECGHIEQPIRRGDVLRITCAEDAGHISDVGEEFVSLRWPWQHDGHGEPHHLAITTSGRTSRADNRARPTLYRYAPDPAVTAVSPGDLVRVDIPPTVVHVSHTTEQWFAEDQQAGRPPQDRDALIHVLPHGVSETAQNVAADRDQRRPLRPWSGDPITIELVCRPYAALENRDQVVDADGRSWTYSCPLDWSENDPANPAARTPRTSGPRWPLVLSERHGGRPTSAELHAVAEATAAGSHADELQRWRDASGAGLVEFDWAAREPVLTREQRLRIADRVCRSVHGKNAPEIREDREEARGWHRMASKVVVSDEDLAREEPASVELDALDDVLETLRLTGADTYEGEDTEFLRRIVEKAIYPEPPRPQRVLHKVADDALECPCPRQACGAVATDLALPNCPQHRPGAPAPETWHAADHCASPHTALVVIDVRAMGRDDQSTMITRVEARQRDGHLLEAAGERCMYDDSECRPQLDATAERRP